ncbi:SBBP repeat-containing protein [Bacteroidota bacterium]
MQIINLLLVIILLFINVFSLTAGSKKSITNNPKFIENKGQWAQEVRFLAMTGGMNAWVTDKGVVYDFYKIENRNQQSDVLKQEKYNHELGITNYKLKDGSGISENERIGHVVKMTFENASANRNYIGIKKSETYFNYFLGNDSDKWASYVPQYEEVIIKNIYDGIDYRLYFDEGNLRYDLNAQPFTKPNLIKMKYEGQDYLEINEEGELVIGTSIGEIINQKLYAWQKQKTNQVDCVFKIDEKGNVGFETNNYNPAELLIIDPVFFATCIGANSNDWGWDIALDTLNNMYITGRTYSKKFPTSIGAYDTTINGNLDCFVGKMSNDGYTLLYSTFIGGSMDDYCYGIAIDKSYYAYVTGFTESRDFPTTSGAFDESYNSGGDIFVSKINADGSSLIYSTYLGGNSSDYGNCIVIDESNNAYITGSTRSRTNPFPTTPGAFNEIFNGGEDIIVSKFSADGSSLVYSTLIGGSAYDWGNSIVLDRENNAYLTGVTASSDFPVTPGAYEQSKKGMGDAFACKLNKDGSSVIYATYIGGENYNYGANDGYSSGNAIAVDSLCNAYITGMTNSASFPVTSGAFDKSFNGYFDSFVCKINNDCSSLVYSTFLGGSHLDQGYDIAVSTMNNAYITGMTYSTNFPTTAGTHNESYNANPDVFICKLDSQGTRVIYSTYIGGSGHDIGYGLKLDRNNNVYLCGSTGSDDFPYTTDTYVDSINKYNNAFICKLTNTCDDRSFVFPYLSYSDYLYPLNDAEITNNTIILTPDKPWSTGAVWHDKVPVNKGFFTEFSFRISGGVDKYVYEEYPGADGIAFVIQNSSPDAIGANGGSIGYGGILNSFVVEYDTYKNDTDLSYNFHDPNENHIAVFCNGTEQNSPDHASSAHIATVDNIIPLVPDGRVFFSMIEYNIEINTLKIWLDSTNNFNLPPALVIEDVNISEMLELDCEEFAWVGFTSATGNAYESHELLSWSYCAKPTEAVLVDVEYELPGDNKLNIYPNPTNGLINIEYSVDSPGNVSLELYDILGNKVAIITEGYKTISNHIIQFNTDNISNGVYYIVMKRGNLSICNKIIIH